MIWASEWCSSEIAEGKGLYSFNREEQQNRDEEWDKIGINFHGGQNWYAYKDIIWFTTNYMVAKLFIAVDGLFTILKLD